jgi:predicted RNase H-like HicB family nuclease
MKFKVKLEECEEGGYAIWVPALPGCFSQGETIDECMKNIREAIELYLESMEDEDKPKKGILVKEISL